MPFAAGADTFGAVLAINFNPLEPIRSFGCCGPRFFQVKNYNMTQQKTAARGMGSSVISFPDRGPRGDNKWRGNASGHVYRTLFEQLSPKVFVDPMVGSGTSIEVARAMGIEAHGLDLKRSFQRGDHGHHHEGGQARRSHRVPPTLGRWSGIAGLVGCGETSPIPAI